MYRLPPQFPRPGGGVLVVRVPVLLVDHGHVTKTEAWGDVLPLRRHEPDDDRRPVQGEGDAEDGRVHPGEDQAARVRRRQRLEEFPIQRPLVLRVAALPVVIVVVLIPPLLLLLLIATLVPVLIQTSTVVVVVVLVVIVAVLIPVPIRVIIREDGVIVVGNLHPEEDGYAEREEGEERCQGPCEGQEGASGRYQGPAEGGLCHYLYTLSRTLLHRCGDQ